LRMTYRISARKSSMLHQFMLPNTTFLRQNDEPGSEVSTGPSIA